MTFSHQVKIWGQAEWHNMEDESEVDLHKIIDMFMDGVGT